MAKVKCRKCDICDAEIDSYDFQYWLTAPLVPILKSGAPILGMKRVDMCDKCMNEIIVHVQEKVKYGMVNNDAYD